jgi:hypothetical protein
VSLKFDGDNIPSSKHYKTNKAITLTAGDRVKVTKISGSYVVEYAVGVPSEPPPPPVDLSGVTAVAADVLAPKVFVNSAGEEVTGTMPPPVNLSGVTAGASDVLTGKVIVNSSGVEVAGSMPNVGAENDVISAKATVIHPPQGYHNGLGAIQISSTEQAKIIAANIKRGITILGVLGSNAVVDTTTGNAVAANILSGIKAWVDGLEVTGNMTNNSGTTHDAVSGAITGYVQFTVPENGFYDTYAKLQESNAHLAATIGLTAAKIKTGYTILGIAGTG